MSGTLPEHTLSNGANGHHAEPELFQPASSGIHNDLQRIRSGFPDGQSSTIWVNGHHTLPTGVSTLSPAAGSRTTDDSPYDLICVGFGPASLAIAIALSERSEYEKPLRALFLERQPSFAWHSGMLLPGTRMQISFMKDLATFRNPQSKFTFLNYLHSKNRLATFCNLGTFLPLREEFNDYLTWCASHFSHQVRYSSEVLSITPSSTPAPVTSWTISTSTGVYSTRNVVIAIGGAPSLPPSLTPHATNPRIIHSSTYMRSLPTLFPSPTAKYNIAIIGGGQSSAEIFHDLHSRYPNARTSLFLRAHALKPSDDSPFVNEIFDPERVDGFSELPEEMRRSAIREDKATNYSVVRLQLIEEIYNSIYQQKLRHGDRVEEWKHRIFPLREVVGCNFSGDEGKVTLSFRNTRTGELVNTQAELGDRADFDAVICGTGYRRDIHETLLKPVVEAGVVEGGEVRVGRDYGVLMEPGMVKEGTGIWLQGCCEGTHGVSIELEKTGKVLT